MSVEGAGPLSAGEGGGRETIIEANSPKQSGAAPGTAADTVFEEVENKLLLLYLIDKMDIPMSNSQIQQFALEENYMNYFMLQQTLADMVELNYIDKTQDGSVTRYSITDEGLTALDYFGKHIHAHLRARINKYVMDNRKQIKRDYEVTAIYFNNHDTGKFIVKCGIIEDDEMLMEINVAVVTNAQAKMICNNWKNNVNKLYGSIMRELAVQNEKDEKDEKDQALDIEASLTMQNTDKDEAD